MAKEQQQNSRTQGQEPGNQEHGANSDPTGGGGRTAAERTISFSSEEPYRRYFGMEILDHAAGAVKPGAPEQRGRPPFNHDVDKVVGRVIRAWMEK